MNEYIYIERQRQRQRQSNREKERERERKRDPPAEFNSLSPHVLTRRVVAAPLASRDRTT